MKVKFFNTLDDCNYQVTTWEEDRQAVQFAVDQIEKYQGKWQIKEKGWRVAVFNDYAKSGFSFRRDSGLAA